MLLVKNELDALLDSPSWKGDIWKALKNRLLGNTWTLKKWQCYSLRGYLLKKTNIENPEQNIIRVDFLIEKGVGLGDPSKQLNTSGPRGEDNASHRKPHKSSKAKIATSLSTERLWNREAWLLTALGYGSGISCNEISFLDLMHTCTHLHCWGKTVHTWIMCG